MTQKLNKTFIIVNKETQEQWHSPSGKSSWKQVNHAKCAFAQGNNKRDPLLKVYCEKLGKYDNLKFKDQDVYEVIELKSEDILKLDKVEELLEELSGSFLDSGNGEVVLELLRCVIESDIKK